jgi:lipoprotein NlpI
MRTISRLPAPPLPFLLLCIAGLVLALALGCERSSRDAEALTSAGVTHLQMQEYDRAIRDFDRALALSPGLVVAWKNRALAHRGKGDYERSLADYDQAIVFAPNDARLITERGAGYVLLGDYPRALKDFDRAIGLKPDHAPAIENRGRVHFYVGNFAQAAADLQRALTFDSTDAYGTLWLHLVRQRMRQDDSQDFAAHAALVDTTRWPAPIVQYFFGRFAADSLRKLAAAPDSTGPGARCVAFYLGEEALLEGELTGAKKLFEETRAKCPQDSSEHKGAIAELQRMAREGAVRSDRARRTTGNS